MQWLVCCYLSFHLPVQMLQIIINVYQLHQRNILCFSYIIFQASIFCRLMVSLHCHRIIQYGARRNNENNHTEPRANIISPLYFPYRHTFRLMFCVDHQVNTRSNTIKIYCISRLISSMRGLIVYLYTSVYLFVLWTVLMCTHFIATISKRKKKKHLTLS